MSCSFCVEFCPFDAIKMNHDYELAAYDRYPQLVYDKAELTVPVEYYAALWPDQWAQEEELRRQAKEEERAKAEAKARAAAEKAARAAGEDEGAQPKRTKAELDALKEQAAAKAAARRSGNGEADSTAAATDEAEAKKARLEELKRKAAEAARKRKESEA